MIKSRGNLPYKALLLSARDAATRFAPCRSNNKRHRDSWRPIVLRWRQRLGRSVNAPAGRAAPAAKILWFPQFHFHFATCVSDRTRSDRSACFMLPAGIHQARVLLDHNWTSVRVAPPAMQPRRTFRPLRAIYSPNSSWRQVPAWAATPGISWTPTAQPIAPLAAHRPRPLVFGRIMEGVRASTQREERTKRFPRCQHIRQHFLQMLSLRAPTLGDHGPHRLQENKRLQFQFGRPEEPTSRRGLRSSTVVAENGRHQERLESFQGPLRRRESKRLMLQFDRPEEFVWRRGQRSPTVMAENGHQERSESFHEPPVHSISSQEVELAVSRAIERAAAPQMTKIDPGLLDRLTDDVIRRVEQRMRIERQRRGL